MFSNLLSQQDNIKALEYEISRLQKIIKTQNEDLAGYNHLKVRSEQERQEMIKAQNYLNAFADENKLFHQFLTEMNAWNIFEAWKNKWRTNYQPEGKNFEEPLPLQFLKKLESKSNE